MKHILFLLMLLPVNAFAASTETVYLLGSASAYASIATATAGAHTTYCNISPRDQKFIFWADIDAVSGGTPTLDLRIEYSGNGGTTWKTLQSFTQATTSDVVVTIHNDESGDSPTWVPSCIRVFSVVGGTTPVYGAKVYMNFERSWF